ncbi:Mpv17 / PMP22 family protein [Nitzschia inconspicua]|uniref:Mpv17 / PMP22 family protein n=1 Tax=Nitzschia inconspicua TaxID=303405 RepID=A0A9K3KGT2_9STRA|nr:Mpv17 / PMP22 family protein [Nitzschia inconspicua]
MTKMRSFAKRLLHRAQHLMEHRPITSNSILCFSLWVAGDSLAQYSEYKMAKDKTESTRCDHRHESFSLDKLDLIRTGQCASYGAFVTGPLIAIWYPLLEKFSKKANPLEKYKVWGGPVFKVLLDQFLMDPPTIVAFFGYMNICEGGNMETFQRKIKNEFLTSWLASMAFWPVVLLGTFRFLPIYAQAPLINACAIVWDAFLSNRNAAARVKQTQLSDSKNGENPKQKESKQQLLAEI